MNSITLTQSLTSAPTKRVWPLWVLLLLYLLVAVESLLVALVFKGTLLVLLAPAGVCWLRALDVWRELKKQKKLG